MQRALFLGDREDLVAFMTDTRLATAPKGTLYPKLCALCSLLIVFALIAIAGTAHLLDHLKPGPYMNLFVELLYLRGILYFGLGIFCLISYYRAKRFETSHF